MRKLLLVYVYASFILWMATAVATIASGALYHNRMLFVTLCFGILMAIFTMAVITTLSTSGTMKRWFETQDELDEMLRKAKASWDNANGVMNVIGEHESVKIMAVQEGVSKYIKNFYTFKDKPYILIGESKLKQPDGEWVPVCIYATLYDCPDGKIWVRYKDQFYTLFNKPTNDTTITTGK